ncbi:fatty acid desaturase family protein [Brenneria rubrifaciens]|uniref:Fatty acid desaturase n=1 Tax=Brenneria rubrifaciens TaxID=55213 RepID=A0A4P8QQ37_9GAMM|nr:fatty acid desaturase [Brenneria rubrifaciens]QCR09201.1 fatty acid desaturase [Brenneria rubrifaciens]
MDAYLVEKIKKINTKKGTFEAFLVAFSNMVIPWIIAYAVCCAVTFSSFYYMLFPFISIYIGTRFRAINNMSHECIHFSFCKNKKLNEFFGEIFAIAEFSKFKLIRKEHLTHHKHLGDMDKDMDFNGIRKYGLHKKMTRRRVLRHVHQALFLRQIKDTFFFIIYDGDAPFWSNAVRLSYVLTLSFLLFSFPLWFLFLFIVPYCYFYQIQKHLTDVLDHGGLLNNDSSIHKSRNFIIKNRFLSALLMPRFDGYHLVHHLLPWLSVEKHHVAHKILLENSEYLTSEHLAINHIQRWLNDK